MSVNIDSAPASMSNRDVMSVKFYSAPASMGNHVGVEVMS